MVLVLLVLLVLLLFLVLFNLVGCHVHSNRTQDCTTRSPQESAAQLVARKSTSRTTKECGSKALLAFRASRARDISLLGLGCVSVGAVV